MKLKTSIWLSALNAAKLKGYSHRNIHRIFENYGVRKVFFETSEGNDKVFVLVSEIAKVPYNPGPGRGGKYERVGRSRNLRGDDKYGLPR